MRILFISMPSIHVIRWIENLKDTSFELYWYDILGRGKLETLETVRQLLETSKRKIPHIKGEYFLSKHSPGFYSLIHPFLEVTENEVLERIIKEINPDIIHSFEMQSCSYPIVKTMNKFPEIKWIYSCWGNDLFYFKNNKDHLIKIRNALARINFIHTDCLRDYQIAKELGFKGQHLGVIPGGTGYKLEELDFLKLPFSERKIILVKGYQHKFGRALNVVKALQKNLSLLQDHEIVIFGAHAQIKAYVEQNKLPFRIFDRDELSQNQVMKLMGESLLYIGNNISDGMANTMLEAIVMGAFPIQSNPGNVSAEIITHGSNGLLIQDPENIDAIAELIIQAIENKAMLENANKLNDKIAIEKLDYHVNQRKVIALYQNLEIKS
ncbi:glycosyltransferase [Flavobacterium sp. CLA17]|uniref:glycosyltransferase n=1 Tax=Flavobacterium sp. CLA17 TaxID=2724135 RepID=UPI001490FCEA|nr:glycosyltransferase [Flavobacterium sp. CLA17]QSB27987.1 glycosyltransferase [Flavobacterium sp. CLA17]